jgi:hypothetical protein
MPIVMALARWWLTNRPARCGLAVAFVITSCSPGGVMVTMWGQVAAPRSLVAFVSRDAGGLDPGLRGQGPWWLGQS